MTSKLYMGALFVLFACNIFLFFKLSKCNKSNRPDFSIQQQEQNLIHESYILYESLDIPIHDLTAYWGNDQAFFNITELTNTPKLIFRYNLSMCTPCIEATLSSIKQVFPDYEKNQNIIFSCMGLDSRLKRSFNGKVNLSFTQDNLPLPLEQHQVPYFFILDKDLKVKSLFVVPKGSKERIVNYLTITNKKYSISNH